MKIVTTQELSNFKILPYDLYNDSNQKILEAGEVLTPGKIIMLKNYPKIYIEEFTEKQNNQNRDNHNNENLKRLMNFDYESLDATDFETALNKEGTLRVDLQQKIKYYYKRVFDLFLNGYYKEGLIKLTYLSNVMISDIFKQLKRSKKGSQIRFLGEYELCHPLNVAVVAGLIANRLEYSTLELEHVILAGLLHDIGKFRLGASDILTMLTTNEEAVVSHTKLGYDLIKELDLPEDIAKVALEHHENNDGSGYPNGLSNDYISELSQIINVANFYDNLACNRTPIHIASNRDALRAMLEVGTKRFSAKILYTFVHMFTYDDPKDFIDMTI